MRPGSLPPSGVHARPQGGDKPPAFIDRYVIQGELGRGRNSVVYRGHDPQDKVRVAVKVLYPGDGLGSLKELGEAVRQEAARVQKLAHPNILSVRDCGVADGFAYMVMPYVEGMLLEESLRSKVLSPQTGVEIVIKCALAVHHAHEQGLMHRDLKPGNIILDGKNEPKVLDFGLSLQKGAPTQSNIQNIVGTPSYMSPEQARGEEQKLTPATDVYALGAILYEVLTHRPPFQADTPWRTLQMAIASPPVPPRQIDPGVDEKLERVTLCCLEKEPARRYGSAEALAEDLRRALNGQTPKGPKKSIFLRRIF